MSSDTKLFTKTKEIGDKQNLQDDIDKLVKWSEKWQMSFNFGKCKCLHIGPGNTNMTYEMGGTILSITEKEKDLGVTMNVWKDNITRVSSGSSRVAELILRITDRYRLKVVQVYAPTTSHSDEETDNFYNTIDKILEKQTHYTIVMGDFNAKVGGQTNTSERATGCFGLGQRNERGDTLVEWARPLARNGNFFKNAVIQKKIAVTSKTIQLHIFSRSLDWRSMGYHVPPPKNAFTCTIMYFTCNIAANNFISGNQ